jgi:hypothetical protein
MIRECLISKGVGEVEEKNSRREAPSSWTALKSLGEKSCGVSIVINVRKQIR